MEIVFIFLCQKHGVVVLMNDCGWEMRAIERESRERKAIHDMTKRREIMII